jgi:predicted phosphoribosyltransferase
VLVDDGLASGFTLRTAVEALRGRHAREIIVAVPTGHAAGAAEIAELVDALYCPNVRGGGGFAVADAYQHWYDVSEDEALRALESFRPDAPPPVTGRV